MNCVPCCVPFFFMKIGAFFQPSESYIHATNLQSEIWNCLNLISFSILLYYSVRHHNSVTFFFLSVVGRYCHRKTGNQDCCCWTAGRWKKNDGRGRVPWFSYSVFSTTSIIPFSRAAARRTSARGGRGPVVVIISSCKVRRAARLVNHNHVLKAVRVHPFHFDTTITTARLIQNNSVHLTSRCILKSMLFLSLVLIKFRYYCPSWWKFHGQFI